MPDRRMVHRRHHETDPGLRDRAFHHLRADRAIWSGARRLGARDTDLERLEAEAYRPPIPDDAPEPLPVPDDPGGDIVPFG